MIDKIKAEIERLKSENVQHEDIYYSVDDVKNATICRHRRILCEELLSFIKSLEKEQSVQGPLTDEYFNRYYTENFDMIHSDLSSREIVRNIAEHFYERGRARKEDEK